MRKAAVGFQPLSEALRVTKLERQSFISTGDDPQSQMGTATPLGFSFTDCEFTENMSSEVLSTEHEQMEDFEKLSPEHVESEQSVLFQMLWSEDWKDCGTQIIFVEFHYVYSNTFPIFWPFIVSAVGFTDSPMRMNPKTPHLKTCEAAAFQSEATTEDRFLQGQTDADACQSSALMNTVGPHDKGVKPKAAVLSKPASTARGEEPAGFSARKSEVCKKVGCAPVPEQVASSSLNFTDNRRGLPVRNPPEKTLDPLSSFLMLRAQQTAPSSLSPSPSQSPASPSGRLMVQLVIEDYHGLVLFSHSNLIFSSLNQHRSSTREHRGESCLRNRHKVQAGGLRIWVELCQETLPESRTDHLSVILSAEKYKSRLPVWVFHSTFSSRTPKHPSWRMVLF